MQPTQLDGAMTLSIFLLQYTIIREFDVPPSSVPNYYATSSRFTLAKSRRNVAVWRGDLGVCERRAM